METLDLDLVFTEAKAALRMAELADPAAAKEVALDLAEVAMLEHGRKEDDPLRAPDAAQRAARGIVKLRAKYRPDLLGRAANVESEMFKPTEMDGERAYLINEAGVWTLTLQAIEEGKQKAIDLAGWIVEWRERVLRR